jgi:PRTRC genetic system protein E
VFVELMPLLGERTVMVTVARLNQNSIRVNVIPSRKREDENAALATPLSFSGTPEELDREFGSSLASYVEDNSGFRLLSPRLRAKWKRPWMPPPSHPEDKRHGAADFGRREHDHQWGYAVMLSLAVRKAAEKVHASYKDNRNVLFWAVNAHAGGDTEEMARAFAKKMRLELPLAFTENASAIRLGVKGYPTLVLLDASGRIRFIHSGYDGSERLEFNVAKEISSVLDQRH